MNELEVVKKEHEKIEQYLLDLEEIKEANPINYPALIHLYKEYFDFWDKHEETESRIFRELKKIGFEIKVKKFISEHGKLKAYRDSILKAIDSGSEAEVKKVLDSAGIGLIKDTREHMEREENFIYSIPE